MTHIDRETAFVAAAPLSTSGPSLIVQAHDLRRAVGFVAKVIERRNTIPVLSTMRLRASGGTLRVDGTDLDMQVTMQVPAQGGDFAATLPPRWLADLLRHLDPQTAVTLSRAADILTIQADGMTARLRELSPVADWPNLSCLDADSTPTIMDAKNLRQALAVTTPCVSTEETRYYLNGIFLHSVGGNLVAVGTDGHRLARYLTGQSWPHPDAILPRKAANILARALATDEAITVTSGERRLAVIGAGWELRTKCIDGTFPNYTKIIPSRNITARVTLTHAALQRLPGDKDHQYLRIDTQDGRMSVADALIGSEVSLPAQTSGEAMKIAFNTRYLRDFTRTSKTIRLDLSGPRDPASVYDDDPRTLRILMPAAV